MSTEKKTAATATATAVTGPVAITATPVKVVNKAIDLCALPNDFRALLTNYKKAVIDQADIQIHYNHEIRVAQQGLDAALHIPHAEELAEKTALTLEELKEARSAALKTAREHTPDIASSTGMEGLYDSYKTAMGNADALTEVFVTWFASQFGLKEIGLKTILRLTANIGARKSTATQLYKTGELTQALSKKAFADLFFRALVDEFSAAGALPKATWTYAPAVEQAVKEARAAKRAAAKV